MVQGVKVRECLEQDFTRAVNIVRLPYSFTQYMPFDSISVFVFETLAWPLPDCHAAPNKVTASATQAANTTRSIRNIGCH